MLLLDSCVGLKNSDTHLSDRKTKFPFSIKAAAVSPAAAPHLLGLVLSVDGEVKLHVSLRLMGRDRKPRQCARVGKRSHSTN